MSIATLVLAIVGGIVAALAGLWMIWAIKSGTLFTRRGPAVKAGQDAMEEFSRGKQYVEINGHRVACIDTGEGEPLLLLHGCPFHGYEWKDVIPLLSRRFRVLAPDLLGLGDTVVGLDADYRLPQDVKMVQGFLSALGIDSSGASRTATSERRSRSG